MEQIRRVMRPTDVPDTGTYTSTALWLLRRLLARYYNTAVFYRALCYI